jgi:hypothetical protein
MTLPNNITIIKIIKVACLRANKNVEKMYYFSYYSSNTKHLYTLCTENIDACVFIFYFKCIRIQNTNRFFNYPQQTIDLSWLLALVNDLYTMYTNDARLSSVNPSFTLYMAVCGLCIVSGYNIRVSLHYIFIM